MNFNPRAPCGARLCYVDNNGNLNTFQPTRLLWGATGIDLILAVFFFAKLGLTYFDFRTTGHFEWSAPAILFACLVFTLTAPLYVWDIIGI